MADNNQSKEIRAEMTWDPQADISIKGHEWEEISKFLQFFQGAMIAFNAVVSRNMASGIVKIKYLYEDNTEVPTDELKRRQSNSINDYLERVRKAQIAIEQTEEK